MKKSMKMKEIREWTKKEFEDIANLVDGKPFLSHYDFFRIRNFKINSFTREDEDHVKEVTERAFKLAKEDKIEDAIKELTELNGVAIPIASAILAVRFPEDYAIIDIRVLKSLNKEEWIKGSKYMKDPQVYVEYMKIMRKQAKERGLKLRDYERSLFEEQ